MAPRLPSREPSIPRYTRALSAPIGKVNTKKKKNYSENQTTKDDIQTQVMTLDSQIKNEKPKLCSVNRPVSLILQVTIFAL